MNDAGCDKCSDTMVICKCRTKYCPRCNVSCPRCHRCLQKLQMVKESSLQYYKDWTKLVTNTHTICFMREEIDTDWWLWEVFETSPTEKHLGGGMSFGWINALQIAMDIYHISLMAE